MKTKEIEISSGSVKVRGILSVPAQACGLVIFAHGSGSGRLSPRNAFVADVLNRNNIATLLMDLLTEEEERDRRNVFDIDLLSGRLEDATRRVAELAETQKLSVGFFGASTGAAAALQAAAKLGSAVKAVVSRGGRPDLAMEFLPRVKAPTLLIVGGDDEPVISMNQEALNALEIQKELIIIPGATHLFEEAGALEKVSELASQWFQKYL